MSTVPLLTQDDLRTLIGGEISIRTIERWRRTGDGPDFITLPKGVRYRPEVVEAWLDQRSRKTRSQRAA